MRRRLSLVFLPLLYAPIGFANDAAWDCEQSKDTKEWLCQGDNKPTTTETEPSEPTTRSAPVKSFMPALTEPYNAPVADKEPELVKPTVQPAKPVQAIAPAKPYNAPVVAEEPRLAAPTVQPTAKPVDTSATTDDAQASESTPEEQEDSVESASTLPVKDTPALTEPDKSISTSSTAAITSTSTSKKAGWNCDAESQDDNWDCQLVGVDPKGKARPVRVAADHDSHSMSLLDPAFDEQQEQNFELLTSQLQYDPWENCESPQKVVHTFTPKRSLRDTSPLELTSDFGEIFDNEIGSYLGNVEIKRADQHSVSHIANYDKISETLDLSGDVYYNEDELALYGRSASIKLASDQSKLRDALFISPASHLRGSSKVVYRDSKTFSRYKDVAYTSCRPGNQDWVLHASQLKLNDLEGKGAVKNAWVEFKGVPVFYTPYLSFPTDDRRTTGFLPPSFHFTKQAGFGLYTPYYWNIAPNLDATFIPRYLTKRGLLLGGDFRYLTEMTNGDVKFEYMPNDSQLHTSRYLGEIINHTVFTPHLSSNLDLNYVSDKNYFSQLGNALSLPNFSYIRSVGDLRYAREGVNFTASADNYQSVDINTTILPYRRLPQLNLNLNHSFKTAVPIDVAAESEWVYFQHGSYVNGQRLNVKPSVAVPFQTANAFITPKLSLQHTEYFLTKQAVSTTPANISRTLPIASLDSGLFFEKEMNLGGKSMLHTLEPRLFYLYVPYTNQNNIPLFDSAQYDFVFASLFRENRFSGTDRIQDANQLSVGLTSRLVDSATGREKLKLNLGDILYFKDRKVTLLSPFYPVETSFTSPIIAELNAELTEHLSLETGLQWDPSINDVTRNKHVSDFTRGKAAIHFVNQPNEIINAGYYYRKNPQIPDRSDDIIMSDVSIHWPVYDDWSVVGRWQYSLLYDRTQEGFFGVEKENCCWRFRVIARHYLNSLTNNNGIITPGINQINAQGQAQTGVFFQLELKGLTGIGERLDAFFEKNIYGYRRPEQ